MTDSITRRRFLQQTSTLAAGLGALGHASLLRGAGSPNEKVVVAVVGCNGRGMAHIAGFLALPHVEVGYVCDVDSRAVEKGVAAVARKQAKKPLGVKDFRTILDRPDLDAISIATPEHWHAPATLLACAAGKHVYVEKPGSHNLREGRLMVAAARKYRRVVQMGNQRRSQREAFYAHQYIANGMLGKVHTVKCWHYATPSDDNPVPDTEPPPELDWDLWLGPLPWRRYNPRYLHGVFRWLLESGGGQIRDRGAHVMSCALHFMNADDTGPVTIETKGRVPTKGLWDAAIDMEVTYQFKNPDWTLEWGQPGNKVGQTEFGNVFWGDKGHLILEWEGGYRPANPEAIAFQLPPGGQEVDRTDEYEDFNMNHKADWFRSIREGTLRPAVDIEIAHRTATLCNLGNLSYLLGRKLVWDGDQERVVGDQEANRYLDRPQRYPYVL